MVGAAGAVVGGAGSGGGAKLTRSFPVAGSASAEAGGAASPSGTADPSGALLAEGDSTGALIGVRAGTGGRRSGGLVAGLRVVPVFAAGVFASSGSSVLGPFVCNQTKAAAATANAPKMRTVRFWRFSFFRRFAFFHGASLRFTSSAGAASSSSKSSSSSCRERLDLPSRRRRARARDAAEMSSSSSSSSSCSSSSGPEESFPKPRSRLLRSLARSFLRCLRVRRRFATMLTSRRQ